MELVKQEITVKLTKGSVDFNKDDLVKGVEEIEKRYSTLVIEEKDIQKAKKDMEDLNRLKTAFSRKRIDTVNEFKKPIEEFENEMKGLEKRVLEARSNIDTQVKSYEDKVKQEKEDKLRQFFDNHTTELEFLKFENVGLNITLSASMKSLERTILEHVENVKKDLALIATQDHKERIQAEYERTLDVNQAIVDVSNQIAREKELIEIVEEKVEVEKPKITPPKEIIEITFTAKGTAEQLIELREFMKGKGISYE